jgi:hypothetical protein
VCLQRYCPWQVPDCQGSFLAQYNEILICSLFWGDSKTTGGSKKIFKSLIGFLVSLIIQKVVEFQVNFFLRSTKIIVLINSLKRSNYFALARKSFPCDFSSLFLFPFFYCMVKICNFVLSTLSMIFSLSNSNYELPCPDRSLSGQCSRQMKFVS